MFKKQTNKIAFCAQVQGHWAHGLRLCFEARIKSLWHFFCRNVNSLLRACPLKKSLYFVLSRGRKENGEEKYASHKRVMPFPSLCRENWAPCSHRCHQILESCSSDLESSFRPKTAGLQWLKNSGIWSEGNLILGMPPLHPTPIKPTPFSSPGGFYPTTSWGLALIIRAILTEKGILHEIYSASVIRCSWRLWRLIKSLWLVKLFLH